MGTIAVIMYIITIAVLIYIPSTGFGSQHNPMQKAQAWGQTNLARNLSSMTFIGCEIWESRLAAKPYFHVHKIEVMAAV